MKDMDMTITDQSTTIDLLKQALADFDAAHRDAEAKIAAAATLKLAVGSNEADRKKQAASMPAEEYAGYVAHYADAEREKAAAVSHLERVEKNLNVLREILSHETMTGYRYIADERAMTAAVEDTTAQRLVMASQRRRTLDTPAPYVTRLSNSRD
jgi:hypothetical protein